MPEMDGFKRKLYRNRRDGHENQTNSTEQDYKKAVARIESLIAAEPGTPEEDELDVLATLVNAYVKYPGHVSSNDFMTLEQMSRLVTTVL